MLFGKILQRGQRLVLPNEATIQTQILQLAPKMKRTGDLTMDCCFFF